MQAGGSEHHPAGPPPPARALLRVTARAPEGAARLQAPVRGSACSSGPAVRLGAPANALCLRRREVLQVPQQTGLGGAVVSQWATVRRTACMSHLGCSGLSCDAMLITAINDAGTSFQSCHAK